MMSLSMKNWSSEGGFSSLVMSVVVMAAGGYRELLGSMKKAERTAKPCDSFGTVGYQSAFWAISVNLNQLTEIAFTPISMACTGNRL